jgi:6,7-dimethyl-8-ribityllumazine synthase
MKEKRDTWRPRARTRLPGVRARALILETRLWRDTMNQTSSSASSSSFPAGNPHRTRVAVICSGWHQDIVYRARDAMLAEFERSGLPPGRVDLFDVPGAFEIPLCAKKLARSRRYDAIIACGLVVNGGIYRHEFVSSAVIDALMRVQIDTEVPVLSAVLTPRDFHEHEDHLRFFAEHFVKKGTEVARACLETMAVHRELDASAPASV